MGETKKGTAAAVACCVALTALFGAAAPASAVDDQAESMYRPGVVNVIKLELPPEAIKALEADPEGEYQTGTLSMAETDGTPEGIGEFSEPIEAQIRLKGSGSFRPLGQKASFKIKFGKKAPFRGLRKMTLNNMVQDTSMIHEALSYRLFHAIGVPASRTSYAELWVNGENYGLRLNLESLDKVALEKRWGSSKTRRSTSSRGSTTRTSPSVGSICSKSTRATTKTAPTSRRCASPRRPAAATGPSGSLPTRT
jgi:hypothetical protein